MCRDCMTENRYQKLMHYVCVEYGYCGSIVADKPLRVSDFIPNSGDVTSEQFAEWVLLADGCGPSSPLKFREKHKKDIIKAFLEYMGKEIVTASELRSDAKK